MATMSPNKRIGFEMVERFVLDAFRHYIRVEFQNSWRTLGTSILLGIRFPRGSTMAVQTVMDAHDFKSMPSDGMIPISILEHISTDMVHQMFDSMETWIKIAKDELKFDEILKIRDIEQRMVALKRYGVEKLLHDAKAELVNKTKRGNELYMIPRSRGLFSVDAFYLKYSCPSTGRLYISGVPPQMGETKHADACMAWKHGLSTEAYQMLNAEA